MSKVKLKIKLNVSKKIFYKCVSFLLFWLRLTHWIYHFHCFLFSFLLLYLFFHLDSLHRRPDFPRFLHFHTDSRPRFQENSYFSLKTNTPPLLLLHNPRYQIIVYIIWDVISDITKKKILKVPKPIIFEVWANNYEWM